ncbi:short chain dehydrogenase/ reductase-like protein [Amylocarpus encephaloides]|uniref:Short chain dehydrogenase/ reductase-like protein n=1 Tax=Amylocarpus encephaloides TaxID=45428 RepID=A0A9P7YI13_9HELO|nr:short chain dehydrogenase/ reductase-like protein [Amylocarpus encephaloides]
MSSFHYRHALLVGATSGIGRSMADKLVESSCKVTVSGRRKERLDEFVKQHGADKASAAPFDISEMEKAPQFAANILKAHPDIDCLFLNAGRQFHYDFSNPASVDLMKFNDEISTNFTSNVALIHAFLPHLLKEEKTSIIVTGTHLALVPAATLTAYSASKSALNSFVICLRSDLRNTNIKVVDILPPMVQSELHDYMGEDKGRAMGMPVAEFTKLAYAGLCSGG